MLCFACKSTKKRTKCQEFLVETWKIVIFVAETNQTIKTMEEELNIREEVKKARAKAAGMILTGKEEEIDAYWDMVCGMVLLAEEALKERDEQAEIASLAREMLLYAEPLEGYDHMLNKLYTAVSRMLQCVFEHPRLKARLLEFEILVLMRIEALEQQEQDQLEDLRKELSQLNRNIALADAGRLDEIEQTGYLLKDPVEWTARWEEVIDEANRKAYRRLKDVPRGMGFCFGYWATLDGILKQDYGLEWRNPHLMNPRVLFD